MAKLTPIERQILDALRDYKDPQKVADMLRVNVRWVERLAEQRAVDADREGPHSMARKLASPYGGYWADWQAAHPEEPKAPAPPKIRPQARLAPPIPKAPDDYVFRFSAPPRGEIRMVPDDQEYEDTPFEQVLNRLAGAVQFEAERGRGAA